MAKPKSKPSVDLLKDEDFLPDTLKDPGGESEDLNPGEKIVNPTTGENPGENIKNSTKPAAGEEQGPGPVVSVEIGYGAKLEYEQWKCERVDGRMVKLRLLKVVRITEEMAEVLNQGAEAQSAVNPIVYFKK